MALSGGRLRLLHLFFLMLGVCLSSALPSVARTLADWEKFDFAKQKIRLSDIRALPLADAKKLRGIVFGRRGRIFDDKEIQSYLNQRSWYKRNPKYKHSQLNATEAANIDVIREAEWLRHSRVVPGDLKFYRSKLLTRAQLGNPSLAELRIMRAEIEAIHGKQFKDDPWLQAFFYDRYWYHPSARYNGGSLIETEWANISLLNFIEKQIRGTSIEPGEMGLFQTRSLRPAQLHGLSLHELRLLRNEIYARRGKRFRTEWLTQAFSNYEWYDKNLLPDFREPKLSTIEQSNLDMIVRRENQIHEDLSRKPLSPGLLKDLYLEDARKLRNEIFARRGRIFKDRQLRGYFQSFAWYKANPRFRESQLNSIERRNAKLIFDYEKKLAAEMNSVEA